MTKKPDKKNAKTPRKKKGAAPKRRSALRWLFKWGFVAAIWGAVAALALIAWYGYDLPDISDLGERQRNPSITLLAADGAIIARYGDLYGPPATIEAMPAYLIEAVLATEDRRFYDHFGLDVFGLARATVANLRAGRIVQGGSTLTQQLAKIVFLTPERTLKRKVQELLLALWLERNFTKGEILSIYLNRVYLGAGAYGVEMAARRYFAKSVARLSLAEAAMIAGLLKAPSRYAPTRNIERARGRARQVLAGMVDAGYLTQAEADAAARNPARVAPSRYTGAGGRYFADWVLDQVAGYAGPGAGDITVITTLDSGQQRVAEQAVARALAGEGAKRGAGQAALVAMSPNGAVRAMVGGRDYATSQFNRASQARRQPGSAFKLFVYLAALEDGLDPETIVEDAPLTIDGWSPRNYDGSYAGRVSLRAALARSLNTVAVRLTERVGRATVVQAARRLGITSTLKTHPSLALGASEVSLIELTAAYAVFANNGRGVWPHGISEIRSAAGERLYRRAGSGTGAVVGRRALRQMVAMLSGVVARGTGRAAAMAWPAAGKTGTSQESRDAWFIGFTRDLVAGVWVGNDDGRPMKGVTGGGLPTRLWADFMRAALAGTQPKPL